MQSRNCCIKVIESRWTAIAKNDKTVFKNNTLGQLRESYGYLQTLSKKQANSINSIEVDNIPIDMSSLDPIVDEFEANVTHLNIACNIFNTLDSLSRLHVCTSKTKTERVDVTCVYDIRSKNLPNTLSNISYL